ncbi:hypothetical protein PPERSA_11504 [Pseudocohnilembus persalinus]|uniref:BZIP domain-containing protein n=1 Tax=Pseudocohnilembus persalinus TaxID=266149 RepID=A0A0V0QX84_PSEPJ|nr:hypothetical protein PPERSA_11504 [Pseudocohnilembus persalinus]|eukprot:KRX06859.1 hypothetical protein PPERSA_11504 [Pseudocohnilembus persalinus]
MDNFYNNQDNFLTINHQHSDNFQDHFLNPDDFLNLHDEKPQTKIEEEDQDFMQKNDFLGLSTKRQSSFLETKIEFPQERNDFLNHQFQDIHMDPQIKRKLDIISGNKKRTMKDKKERAKLLMKQKQQQLQVLQQQDLLKQENDSNESTNEVTPSLQSQEDNNITRSPQISSLQQPIQNPQISQNNSSFSNINSQQPTQQQQQSNNTNNSENIDKPDKGMLQKIRNRISAQNSRDRKKAYIQEIEAQNQQYLKQNTQLQQRVLQLIEQNDNTKKENLKLKKQLQDLKKKYGEPIDEDDYFKDPIINSKKSGNAYGAIGLAIFSLISIIMMSNLNNSKNQNSLNLISKSQNKIELSLENELSTPNFDIDNFKQLDKNDDNYEQLQSICESLHVQDKQNPSQSNEFVRKGDLQTDKYNSLAPLSQNQQQFEMQLEDQNYQQQKEDIIQENQQLRTIKFEQNKSIQINKQNPEATQNLRTACKNCPITASGNNNGLVQVTKQVNSNPILSTIYCPKPYKYVDASNNNPLSHLSKEQQQEILQNGTNFNYQGQEYLQLFIPKDYLNLFTQQYDNIYVNENQEDLNNGIVEIIAKVESVRVIQA